MAASSVARVLAHATLPASLPQAFSHPQSARWEVVTLHDARSHSDLQKLGLPVPTAPPESGARFADGLRYRVEIPSTEGPWPCVR